MPMTTPRVDHSSTALTSGTVVMVGGRETPQPGSANFLDTIEVFPLRNSLPTVPSAMTAMSSLAGTLLITVNVADAENDGGYVIIRFRTLPSGTFRRATIDAQSPSTAGANFPNFQVSPGVYAFRWDTAADGVSSGASVEIEVLPVGTTLGSAVRFNAQVP